ncbi:MAG: M20/M25/M40 family metallo-hydrolase, partial [Betaproteobacteria bacterium]|nr:M20/M25/M40 family metallo-hydrolase [Betaproteobacteria bacterium]
MNAREGFTAAPQPDPQGLQAYANDTWEREIVPALTDYIAVPAKSPAYDAQWAEHGYIERIITQAAAWVDSKRALAGQGLSLEIIRIAGRTPVLFFDLPATRAGNTDTVLMYGHLDKQPEFNGWRKDLGPWTPKYEGGKLYGRGGADDGYA